MTHFTSHETHVNRFIWYQGDILRSDISMPEMRKAPRGAGGWPSLRLWFLLRGALPLSFPVLERQGGGVRAAGAPSFALFSRKVGGMRSAVTCSQSMTCNPKHEAHPSATPTLVIPTEPEGEARGIRFWPSQASVGRTLPPAVFDVRRMFRAEHSVMTERYRHPSP